MIYVLLFIVGVAAGFYTRGLLDEAILMSDGKS